MRLADKTIVITGAGSGIGAALANRFAAESPRGLILADLNLEAVTEVAEQVGGVPFEADVSSSEANAELIGLAENRFGPVDLFCANAGYGAVGDEQSPTEDWDRMWHVNFMSHVHAARHLIPGWVERGDGYLLVTASAAGLLTNLRAAQYSVTKHAAVAFAEWLAVTYGDAGVKVSCLCPQFVNTALVEGADEFELLAQLAPLLEPEEVAESVVAGLDAEEFLILPHPEVAQYFKNKANDYDRWIGGMRKLQRNLFPPSAE
ncbi:MAG: SDR family oxidoreductase [Acidimicrobiia bacterium]|nr:SDR family oxidoreductase [Acidimicrobiia bacterium]